MDGNYRKITNVRYSMLIHIHSYPTVINYQYPNQLQLKNKKACCDLRNNSFLEEIYSWSLDQVKFL